MFYVASTLGCYWIAIDCLLMDVVFEGWLACHQAGLGNTLGLVAGDAAVVAWRVQSHRERWLDGCRVLSSLGGLYLSQQVRGHIARAAGIGSDDVSKTRIELHSRHVVIHEHDAEHLGSITFTIAPTAEVFSSAFLEDPGVVLLFPSMAFAHLFRRQ